MLFDPDAKLDPAEIIPPSSRLGAAWRACAAGLHVLGRANGESLTTRAITLQVMAGRGFGREAPQAGPRDGWLGG
jgi:hypothetical protein